MNRYRVTHPHTAAVTFPTMQDVGDFLCHFRHSPDFSLHRIHDRRDCIYYTAAVINGPIYGVEISREKTA